MMPSLTERLTSGFEHAKPFFLGFGGHLHLSSSSWGTGSYSVCELKPTLGAREGVKPGAANGEAYGLPEGTPMIPGACGIAWMGARAGASAYARAGAARGASA